MDDSLKIFVIVFCRDTHHMAPEGAEDCTLLGLGIDIRPHLFGRTMLNLNFTIVDLFFDVKIRYLICFVRFELLAFPFDSSRMALLLS
jgi:hypothetical protein